jgi:hypothetical protein
MHIQKAIGHNYKSGLKLQNVLRRRLFLPDYHFLQDGVCVSLCSSEYCKLTYTFQDMAAHSAYDFRGGSAEHLALAKYRKVIYIWTGRVLNSQLTNEELWNAGRCAFTPEEIGLFLVALGFGSRTQLCLASHKV